MCSAAKINRDKEAKGQEGKDLKEQRGRESKMQRGKKENRWLHKNSTFFNVEK
jgi:hypothetical protein